MSVQIINQSKIAGFEQLSPNIDPMKMAVAIMEAQEMDLRPFMGKAFYDDFIQYFSNNAGLGTVLLNPTNTTTAANGNYLNQAVTAVTGTGTGAKATVSVYAGRVSAVVITTPGTGYALGDQLSFSVAPGATLTVGTLTTEIVIAGGITAAYTNLYNGQTYTDLAGHNISYKGLIPALAYWTLARFIENASFEYTGTGGVIKNHDNSQPIAQRDIAVIAGRKRSMANAKANDIEQFLWNNRTTYPLWRFNERNKNSRQPGARITAIDRTDYNGGGYNYNNGLGLDGFITNI